MAKNRSFRRKRLCIPALIRAIALLLLAAVLAGCSPQGGTPTSAGSAAGASGQEESEDEMTPEEWKVILNQSLNKTHYGGDYYLPAFGLCEDYPVGTTAETVEQDFSLLSRYGIRRVRISVAWGDYEPRKGVYNWDFLDTIVSLAEEYGIELYPYICYSATWATGGDWLDPVQDLQDWYDFVYALADRYKGRIHQWEIWNEGDNKEFWGGTWKDLLELAETGARAVKDADPDAKTIFSGLTDTGRAHVQSIYTAGVADYFDIIDVHGYNETWNPSSTEDYGEMIADLAGLIKTNGAKQELWVGEIGYSDYVQESGQVSGQVWQEQPYEKTQPFQAVTFLRTYTTIAATDEVCGISWYEIKNLRLDSAAIGDVNNYFLGCLDHNYFPKPLWFAVTMGNGLFSSPHRPIDDELTVAGGQRGAYVHAFEQENGCVILAAWNRGSEAQPFSVTVPGAFAQAVSYSPTGEKSLLALEPSAAATTLELTLEPDGIQLLELFPGDLPARLTIDKPVLTQTGDGTIEIRATIRNIGGAEAAAFEAELFVDAACAWTAEETVLPVEGLAPGEETSVVWSVTKGDGDEPLNAWCVAHPTDSPLAAVSVQG